MSHIFWYWGDNQKGGMWTQDYTGINKFATSNKDEVSYEKHVSVANDLVTLRKDQLFENAYNVERYFYIKLNNEAVSYTHLTLPTTLSRRVDLGGRRNIKKKKKKGKKKKKERRGKKDKKI